MQEQTFTVNVAMDIRAYGFIEVEAESAEAALAQVDAQHIANNFEPRGHGRDDYDKDHPINIYITDIEDEDGETAWDEGAEIESPWEYQAAKKDNAQALETIWDALNAFREDCISEGEEANDSQWGEICAAMAVLASPQGES